MHDHHSCSTEAPLHEGMRFIVAHPTGVAMRLSTLWAAMSLAAQSILGHLPADVSHVDVVGGKVDRFQERAEQCSHLKNSSSRVYDLVLGSADDRVHLVVHLEEAVGCLQAMQDEHQAFQSSVIRIWDLVLQRFDEAPSIVAALSSTTNLIEGRVDAAATNRVHWGGRLALTIVLLHFSKLGLELELLGSEYNADLTKDDMDVFWTGTHQSSESLSSRVPLLVAHSPPNGTGKE
jgi:hypothetical protein